MNDGRIALLRTGRVYIYSITKAIAKDLYKSDGYRATTVFSSIECCTVLYH